MTLIFATQFHEVHVQCIDVHVHTDKKAVYLFMPKRHFLTKLEDQKMG